MIYSKFQEYSRVVIEKFYQELKSIDDDFSGGKVLKFRNYRLKVAHFFYESFRKNIRKLYMSEESQPMDRHKIAANVMCSLLKARVIKVNRLVKGLPLELLAANEYIAFNCALNIVELYVQDMGYQDYELMLPGTYIEKEGENSYIENVCKALYYTKHLGISDIFSYANTLFLLEKYTDTVLKIDKTVHKTHS